MRFPVFARPASFARPVLALAFALAATSIMTSTAARAAQEGDHAGAAHLVVADAVSHTLTVLDAARDERLATFATPGRIGNLVRSSTGRWVLAVHTDANKLTILDSGLRRVDHGDHMDLEVAAPFVRATVYPGRKPIDFWTGSGMATVHNDDDGTLAILDEERLEEGTEVRRIRGAGSGHNNSVILEDTVLLSLASEGRITAYGLADGAIRQTFEGCPGTHGWTTRGRTFAAAGCTDGVMLFTKEGSEVTARTVAEPADSPENARVSTITSHRGSDVLVGNFGQGLALIRPADAELRSVPLPSTPVRFAFDHDGKRMIALTLDGRLHALDPASGELLWSIDAVAPVDTATTGAPRPSLAVGEEVAYVADPSAGQIVKIDLALGRTFGTPLAVGGTPTALALVEMDGAQH
jgi:hypothetical protein